MPSPPLPDAPAEWLAACQTIFADVCAFLDARSVAYSPELALALGVLPTPHYNPATIKVGMNLPAPSSVEGRFFWIYLARGLGLDSVDEAVQTYYDELPLFVAHEVVHHLRDHHGLYGANSFVEEQVANMGALAFLHEHPAYQHVLPLAHDVAERVIDRMAAFASAAVSYRAGLRFELSEILFELGVLERQQIEELRPAARAQGVALETLLLQHGLASQADLDRAAACQERTREYFNQRYRTNYMDGVYFTNDWIKSYLQRPYQPTFAEVVAGYVVNPALR